MIDDTTLNKSAIIYCCLKRIADEMQGDFKRRKILRFKIPSFLICFVLAERRLGIPQSSRETIDLLYLNSLISEKNLPLPRNTWLAFEKSQSLLRKTSTTYP
jgi:hypothetical protein